MKTTEFSFLPVSTGELKEMVKNAVSEVMCAFSKQSPEEVNLNDWCDEEDAMKTLKRKKTWFHNRRKDNTLPGKKAGGKWWYKKEDLIRYIEKGVES